MRKILAHKKFNGDEEKAIAQLLEWNKDGKFVVAQHDELRDIKVLSQIITILTKKYGVTHCYIDSVQQIDPGVKIKSSSSDKQAYLDEEASIIMSQLWTVAKQTAIPITLIAAGRDYWIDNRIDESERLRSDIDCENYLDDLLYSFEYYQYSKIILGLELLKPAKKERESVYDLIIYLLKDNNRPPNNRVVMDFYGDAVTVSDKRKDFSS